MTCEEHGTQFAMAIDHARVNGRDYTRFICSECDNNDADWWEDDRGIEVSSPYDDDNTDEDPVDEDARYTTPYPHG